MDLSASCSSSTWDCRRTASSRSFVSCAITPGSLLSPSAGGSVCGFASAFSALFSDMSSFARWRSCSLLFLRRASSGPSPPATPLPGSAAALAPSAAASRVWTLSLSILMLALHLESRASLRTSSSDGASAAGLLAFMPPPTSDMSFRICTCVWRTFICSSFSSIWLWKAVARCDLASWSSFCASFICDTFFMLSSCCTASCFSSRAFCFSTFASCASCLAARAFLALTSPFRASWYILSFSACFANISGVASLPADGSASAPMPSSFFGPASAILRLKELK